jgi:CBS domain-containing protein
LSILCDPRGNNGIFLKLTHKQREQVSVETLQTNRDTLLMPLSDAIGMTEKMTILKSSDSLDKLLHLFTFEHTHRVLIEQANATFVLLSQMDLIRFLQAFNHQLGSAVLDLSVTDIKRHGIRSTLNFKCTAAEAFLKLAADNTISALPIVDDNGDVIGEISAKDLRGLNRNRWDSLLKPVVMFLKASHGDLYPPLTCHDRFTLSQIMSAFVLRKAYRLWWMDNTTGELKGVITLTDILSTFASHH